MISTDTFLSEWNKRENSETRHSKLFNDDLEAQLSKSGVGDHMIRINHIKSLKHKKGNLKRFLKWITDHADKNEFSLSIAVQPTGRYDEDVPKKDKLKEVVGRYGFKLKFEYPDGLGYEMIRTHNPEEWEWYS